MKKKIWLPKMVEFYENQICWCELFGWERWAMAEFAIIRGLCFASNQAGVGYGTPKILYPEKLQRFDDMFWFPHTGTKEGVMLRYEWLKKEMKKINHSPK